MESNKKQTAVEYLEDKLFNRPIRPLFVSISVTELSQLLNQAKQMEREQIEIAFSKSYLIGLAEVNYDDVNREANRYYQNTYGK